MEVTSLLVEPCTAHSTTTLTSTEDSRIQLLNTLLLLVTHTIINELMARTTCLLINWAQLSHPVKMEWVK